MKKLIVTALAVTTAFTAATTALAGSNDGKIQVKLLATGVLPDGKITEVRTNAIGLSGAAQTSVTDSVVPTVAAEYFISPNFSIETICCITPHDVRGQGALAGAQLINNAIVLPATVTIKYHLNTGSGFKPYVGAGPAHFFIFSEDVGPSARALGVTRADLSDEFGIATQAGFDLPINDKGLGLSVDAKKYFVKTTASFFAGNTLALRTRHDVDPWVISAGLSYRF